MGMYISSVLIQTLRKLIYIHTHHEKMLQKGNLEDLSCGEVDVLMICSILPSWNQMNTLSPPTTTTCYAVF